MLIGDCYIFPLFLFTEHEFCFASSEKCLKICLFYFIYNNRIYCLLIVNSLLAAGETSLTKMLLYHWLQEGLARPVRMLESNC
jgi:hypothetical protein